MIVPTFCFVWAGLCCSNNSSVSAWTGPIATLLYTKRWGWVNFMEAFNKEWLLLKNSGRYMWETNCQALKTGWFFFFFWYSLGAISMVIGEGYSWPILFFEQHSKSTCWVPTFNGGIDFVFYFNCLDW